MTREARLAAGWVELWGVFDHAEKRWMGTDNRFPHELTPSGLRWGSDNHRLAANTAYQKDIGVCVPRPFWRRKKPKAPPPLAVGDEVVVRGKVREIRDQDGFNVRVVMGKVPGTESPDSRWFRSVDLERCKP